MGNTINNKSKKKLTTVNGQKKRINILTGSLIKIRSEFNYYQRELW